MDAASTPTVTLSWSNIRVRVKDDRPAAGSASSSSSWSSWLPRRGEPLLGPARQRVLIDGVSGAVDGGSFLAVVGASGTGKTTLLAAVTKRLRGRAVTGDVLLNGRAASAKLLSRVCGFVPQKDLATESLTTTEHLHFMAVMRLDARVSAAARARRIRVLLGDLGLTACADTRLQHLSGGERRRVALAVQLMVSPLVLALDEPCSGLDAEGSRVVLEALRREAGRGRAVLCTVHQAAADLLRLFSHILVLASGRVVFHGPMQDAQPFLATIGARRDWTPSTPLNTMLQQLCDPAAHLDTARVCRAFATTSQAQILEEYPVSKEVLARDVIRPPDIKHVSWFSEVSWLVWREVVDGRRQNSRVIAQVTLILVTGAIMSLAFMDSRLDSLAGVQSIRGVVYLTVSEVAFTHSYAVFHTFPSELTIFLRESHLYSSSAYYVGKVLAGVPRCVLEPMLFVGVIQTQVDLTAGGGVLSFLFILGILFLTALTASAYGCMLSAQFEEYATVLSVTQPIEFMLVLAAGMFNTIRSLPYYVRWTRFLSVFFYCHELLSINYWQNVSHIDCPASPNLPCLKDGEAVLEDLGFDSANMYRNLLCMGALCLGLHVVGYLGVLRRSRQQSAY